MDRGTRRFAINRFSPTLGGAVLIASLCGVTSALSQGQAPDSQRSADAASAPVRPSGVVTAGGVSRQGGGSPILQVVGKQPSSHNRRPLNWGSLFGGSSSAPARRPAATTRQQPTLGQGLLSGLFGGTSSGESRAEGTAAVPENRGSVPLPEPADWEGIPYHEADARRTRRVGPSTAQPIRDPSDTRVTTRSSSSTAGRFTPPTPPEDKPEIVRREQTRTIDVPTIGEPSVARRQTGELSDTSSSRRSSGATSSRSSTGDALSKVDELHSRRRQIRSDDSIEDLVPRVAKRAIADVTPDDKSATASRESQPKTSSSRRVAPPAETPTLADAGPSKSATSPAESGTRPAPQTTAAETPQLPKPQPSTVAATKPNAPTEPKATTKPIATPTPSVEVPIKQESVAKTVTPPSLSAPAAADLSLPPRQPYAASQQPYAASQPTSPLHSGRVAGFQPDASIAATTPSLPSSLDRSEGLVMPNDTTMPGDATMPGASGAPAETNSARMSAPVDSFSAAAGPAVDHFAPIDPYQRNTAADRAENRIASVPPTGRSDSAPLTLPNVSKADAGSMPINVPSDSARQAPRSAQPSPAQPSPAQPSPGPATVVDSGNTRQLPPGNTAVATELPSIRVVTHGPGEMMIRQTRQYEIRVENRGSIDAEGLLVRAMVPDWAEVKDQQTSQGRVEKNSDDKTERLTWTIDRLPAGKTETMLLQLKALRSGLYDVDVDWTLVPQRSVAKVRVQQPKLSLFIDGPDEVIYGESETYKVRVLNPGDGIAPDVVFTLSPNSATPQSQKIGNIPAGKEAQFEVELTAHDLGDLRIHGLAAGDLELRAEADKVIRVSAAKLEAVLSGPQLKYQNAESTYQLTLRNVGTAISKNVVATLRLPAGVKYLGGLEGASVQDNELRWKIDSMSPKAIRQYDFKCQMTATGEQLFAFDCAGTAAGTASVSLGTSVEAIADLVLSVNDPPAPAPIDEDVVYEIIVRNRGSKEARNVRAIAQFSHGIEPHRVAGQSGEVLTGQVLFDPIDRIAPGQEIRLQVIAKAQTAGHHRFRTEIRSGDITLLAEEATHYMSPNSDRVSRRSTDGDNR